MTFELSTNKYLFDIKIIIEEYNENFSENPRIRIIILLFI